MMGVFSRCCAVIERRQGVHTWWERRNQGGRGGAAIPQRGEERHSSLSGVCLPGSSYERPSLHHRLGAFSRAFLTLILLEAEAML